MADWSEGFSSGVQRLMAAAEQAAQAAGRELRPFDLLQAMLDDEGHATELLRSARLTLSDDHRDGGEPFSAGRLLRSARQLTGAGEETSSLHLLVALIQSDDLLAIRLADHGLSEDTIREQFPTGNAPPGASISTDIRIAPAAAAVDDLSATWRILDAAANRAREGLRVLEDHARFGLDDAHLTERLKQVRHRLAELLQTLLGDRAIRLRNTPGDVGTAVHTRFEASRDTERDIVRANACRVQEALRTLEEYSKRIDSFSAAQIGQLRYESYPLEQALLTAQMARGRLGGVSLCLLATDALCPQGVGPVVLAALEAGCPMVQLREKSVPDDQLLLRAKLLREWTRETGALLIINDRPDLAVLVDADGVHVGQEDLPVAAVRRIVGSDRLVGVSTHNLAQVRKAVDDGADYLGVGPVFPSSTKSFDNFVGLEFVQAAVQETSLPYFAIGGVDAANVSQVAASGCRRVAVSGAICSASDPSAATRKLLDQLEAPQKSD